jgi:hypothetical protein
MVFIRKLLTDVVIVDLYFLSWSVWGIKKKEIACFALINYIIEVRAPQRCFT